MNPIRTYFFLRRIPIVNEAFYVSRARELFAAHAFDPAALQHK